MRRKRHKHKMSETEFEEESILLSEEQTILSKERTILSFMQTGVAFITLGLVIVNLFRNMQSELIGWALILLGFVEVLESLRRLRKYKKLAERIKNRAKMWV